jgi:hypothetical protein
MPARPAGRHAHEEEPDRLRPPMPSRANDAGADLADTRLAEMMAIDPRSGSHGRAGAGIPHARIARLQGLAGNRAVAARLATAHRRVQRQKRPDEELVEAGGGPAVEAGTAVANAAHEAEAQAAGLVGDLLGQGEAERSRLQAAVDRGSSAGG